MRPCANSSQRARCGGHRSNWIIRSWWAFSGRSRIRRWKQRSKRRFAEWAASAGRIVPTHKTRMSRGRERRVAGRDQILAAARAIGVRKGWSAVTIRSVAQELGYKSPLLYEHFRDKEDLLTQIAVEAIARFEKRLMNDLPEDGQAAFLAMVERYWTFMLRHTQLYRLANGMDGVPIDRKVVGRSAQSLCRAMGDRLRPLLADNATG